MAFVVNTVLMANKRMQTEIFVPFKNTACFIDLRGGSSKLITWKFLSLLDASM